MIRWLFALAAAMGVGGAPGYARGEVAGPTAFGARTSDPAWQAWNAVSYVDLVSEELPRLDETGAPLLRSLVSETLALLATERGVPTVASAVDLRRLVLALRAADELIRTAGGGLAVEEQVMALAAVAHAVSAGDDRAAFEAKVREEQSGRGATESAGTLSALLGSLDAMGAAAAELFAAHRDRVLRAVPNRVDALMWAARVAMGQRHYEAALDFARRARLRQDDAETSLLQAAALAFGDSTVQEGLAALRDASTRLEPWDDRAQVFARRATAAGELSARSTVPDPTLADHVRWARSALVLGRAREAASYLDAAAATVAGSTAAELGPYLRALAGAPPLVGALPPRIPRGLSSPGLAAWVMLMLEREAVELAPLAAAERVERLTALWSRLSPTLDACGAECAALAGPAGQRVVEGWMHARAMAAGDGGAEQVLFDLSNNIIALDDGKFPERRRAALAWMWVAGHQGEATQLAWAAAESAPADHRNAAGACAASLALATAFERGDSDLDRARVEVRRLSGIASTTAVLEAPPRAARAADECPPGGCFDAHAVRALAMQLEWLDALARGEDAWGQAVAMTRDWLRDYPQWPNAAWLAPMRSAAVLALVFEALQRSAGGEEAAALVDLLRSIEPTSAGAAYAAGLIALAEGRFGEARGHLQRVIRRDEQPAAALMAHLVSARTAQIEGDPPSFALHLGAADALWHAGSPGVRTDLWRSLVPRSAVSASLGLDADGRLAIEVSAMAVIELWQPIRGFNRAKLTALLERLRELQAPPERGESQAP